MKRNPHTIYQKLYACFGPQRWWPADSAFEVIVGAILTQNTSWSNVEKAIDNLKQHSLLRPRELYALPESRLASLIRSAGYFNIKAKRLKHFLHFLFHTYNGSLKEMGREGIGSLRLKLLSVNGIGPETADSILLYAFKRPVFVVDAYTKRIFARLGLITAEATYDEVQAVCTKALRSNTRLFNEYHALIVKLGKEICLKNKPRCAACPLKGLHP